MEPGRCSPRRIAATLAALLLVGLIGTAPAGADDRNAIGNAPFAPAKALTCEVAKAKLKRAKQKLAKAKKAVKRAKKSGKRAKLRKAKKKLKKAKKAVKKAKGQLVGCDDGGAVGGDAQKVANEVLSRAPHKPADIDLFSSKYSNGDSGLYPEGSAMTPAAGPPLTESQARAQLAADLQNRLGSGSPKVTAALAYFDRQKTKDLIADPTLRASYAELVGTFCEPAMDYVVDSGNFIEIKFGPLSSASTFAHVSGPDGGRTVVFNRIYESEDIRYLAPTACHEALHDDQDNSDAEEVVNHAINAMVTAQLLSDEPELAYAGTVLGRSTQTDTLIFLNSREKGSPDSEIYAPSGTGAAPGSPFDHADLWTIFGGRGTSPASQFVSRILTGLGLPAASNFSQATAESFENLNDEWLTDVQRLQVEVLLQMVSLEDITDVSGLGRQQAIDLLGLKPYLDAID